jgi:hypothetical protein
MVYLHTKNQNLGIFWRALEGKMLVNIMAIWYRYISSKWYKMVYFITIWCIFLSVGIFLRSFGIFGGHLVLFSPFWYVVPRKIRQC